MRYLVAVDDCFVDRPCGAGRVAWDIAQLARDHGHDVAMVALHDQKTLAHKPDLEELEGIRVLRVKKPTLPAWNPRRLLSAIDAVAQAVQQTLGSERWDVLHMHTTQTGVGAHKALGPQVRRVATVHSPVVMEYYANTTDRGLVGRVKSWLGVPLLRHLERQVLQASDAIHTLSQFTRVNLEYFHGVGDRVTIIPHWKRPELERTQSKAEARAALGWPEQARIFFTVRHHSPRNGIDLAIQAVAPFVRAKQCHFYVGGDGPLRQHHEAMARELQLEQVHFLGRISDETLALAYQSADAFLLPTRALECFGLIILEALAFGCPIISSNAGAIPELLQPILPNWLFPAGDVKAMQARLEAFLTEQDDIPSPEALTEYVSRRFGRDVIGPQILKWLEV